MKGVAVIVKMVLVGMMAARWAAAEDVPLVDTEHGRISGIVERSMEGQQFYSFYGIPYAKPPLGKLRFKVIQKEIYITN